MTPKLNIPLADRPIVLAMLADRTKWSAERLANAGYHAAAEAIRRR